MLLLLSCENWNHFHWSMEPGRWFWPVVFNGHCSPQSVKTVRKAWGKEKVEKKPSNKKELWSKATVGLQSGLKSSLMLQVMALTVMAVMFSYSEEDLDPVLPTPLSAVDNINFEVSGSGFEVTLNDGSSNKLQPLLPHGYQDLLEPEALNSQDMNVGVVVTFCTFAMNLMLLYGTVKGKPSYLIPFFCLQIFDFFVTSISGLSYLCYPADANKLLMQSDRLPSLRDKLLGLHPHTLGLIAIIIFMFIMCVKAYFIGIIWNCYKYLTLRQIAVQRTVHFIDPDVQNLLPDLPDYETAVKKYPTPPPSYATAVMGLYPVMEGNSQPLPAQNVAAPSAPPTSASESQTSGRVNVV